MFIIHILFRAYDKVKATASLIEWNGEGPPRSLFKMWAENDEWIHRTKRYDVWMCARFCACVCVDKSKQWQHNNVTVPENVGLLRHSTKNLFLLLEINTWCTPCWLYRLPYAAPNHIYLFWSFFSFFFLSDPCTVLYACPGLSTCYALCNVVITIYKGCHC